MTFHEATVKPDVGAGAGVDDDDDDANAEDDARGETWWTRTARWWTREIVDAVIVVARAAATRIVVAAIDRSARRVTMTNRSIDW